MTDDTTLSNKTKEVLHTYRYYGISPKLEVDSSTATNGYRWIYTDLPGNRPPAILKSCNNAYNIISQIDWSITYAKTVEQLRTEALQKFYNDNTVNSVLNIIEAPSLVSTLNDLNTFFKGIRRPSGWLKSIKRLPSLHLGYSFGVAPLIADLRKLSSELPKLRETLKKVRDNAGKPRLFSSLCKGQINLALPGGANGYYGPNPSNDSSGQKWWYGKTSVVTAPTRRVIVKGASSLHYDSAAFSAADSILRSLVTSGPASLAWELTPFSFVADWFVNTQELMLRLDNILTGNSKSVRDIWSTELWELKVPITLYKRDGNRYSTDGITAGKVHRRYYHRKPISPEFSFVANGRFGKKQAALSASLLYQIVAKLKG